MASHWKTEKGSEHTEFLPLNGGPHGHILDMMLLARLIMLLVGDESAMHLLIPCLYDMVWTRNRHFELTAEVIASAAHIYAQVAGACAIGGNRWGFDSAVGTLLKMHKFPQSDVSSAMLHGVQKPTTSQPRISGLCPGALAKALNSLSKLLSYAQASFKNDWMSRLLSLYSDFALMLPNDSYAEDLGSLLPAISSMLVSKNTNRHSKSSSISGGDLSLDALADIQNMNRDMESKIRLLWLTSSFWDFGGILESSDNRSEGKWPVEWEKALATIAASSESFLLGLEQQPSDSYLEALSAEYEPFLKQFTERDSLKWLMDSLMFLMGDSLENASTSLPAPLAAHVLAIGYMGAVHTKNYLHAINIIGSSSPLAGIVAILQSTSRNSVAYPWFIGILDTLYSSTTTQVKVLSTSNLLQERVNMLVAAKDNVSLLTKSLVVKNTSNDLAVHISALLDEFLTSFPALLFRKEMFEVALWAVAEQEIINAGQNYDVLASTTFFGTSSLALKHMLSLVSKAAKLAPHVCEAVIMEEMRLLAGRSGRHSNIAAQIFPQIMKALQDGRTSCSLPDVTGSFKGLVAWTSKIQAVGTVNGMLEGLKNMHTEDEVVQRCAEKILVALKCHSSDEEIGWLATEAAAAIVSQSTDAEETFGMLNLIRLIAWLPISRFTLHIMQVSISVWHWIIASVKERLQNILLEEISAAWVAGVSSKVGIFSAGSRSNDKEPINLLEQIKAHHGWIVFFAELYNTQKHTPFSSGLDDVLLRILSTSFGEGSSNQLTKHPAAISAYFRLVTLGITFSSRSHSFKDVNISEKVYSNAISALLAWFEQPMRWFEAARNETMQSVNSINDLLVAFREISKTGLHGKVEFSMTHEDSIKSNKLSVLINKLLEDEKERLTVWLDPLDQDDRGTKKPRSLSLKEWAEAAEYSWNISPSFALGLANRYPSVSVLQERIAELVYENAGDPAVQEVATASKFLVLSLFQKSKPDHFVHLSSWAPAPLDLSMFLLSGISGRRPEVRSYVVRSISSCDPKDVAFYLPQLVQTLRCDPDGIIEGLLVNLASRSSYFSYLLVCQLASEGTPPDEAFAPVVKRSNWSPPEDTGLWSIADEMRDRLWDNLHGPIRDHLDAQLKFFDEVTSVSGKLYPVPKEERKGAAVEFLSRIKLPREDLFMPTDPHSRIISIRPESATPMQSAAKCPFLAAFDVERETPSSSIECLTEAAIFKVGDDCRQDVLALQVLSLLKKQFNSAGLSLNLVPYNVVPTGYECGVIEVVPNAKSRAQLGQLTDGGLFEIFQREFGLPGSKRFETARLAFIESSAAYAVASYLLQAKDRHNGNIMLDNKGNIVHIDFGFILGISPGGNMGFESAAFKLSYEMTQLLDPGNTRKSPEFLLFQELCVKGFLAARTKVDSIVATVSMMEKSGLPCFGYRSPVESLRKRFHLEMSYSEAAAWMKQLISDAYDKWTTGVYDLIQYYQNAIPK